MNWQKVLSRLSIPGVILLVLGAVTASQAERLFENGRLCMAVRAAGLMAALLGAAVLLDVFPGL